MPDTTRHPDARLLRPARCGARLAMAGMKACPCPGRAALRHLRDATA